jgi:hypothetical protein
MQKSPRTIQEETKTKQERRRGEPIARIIQTGFIKDDIFLDLLCHTK